MRLGARVSSPSTMITSVTVRQGLGSMAAAVGIAAGVGGASTAVTVEVPVTLGKDEVERLALAEPKVADFLAGAVPKKVIVVPGKIVNIVV